MTALLLIALAQPQTEPPVPRAMPKLDLKDTKGTRWTNELMKNDGKVYLIEFWATWCTSCKAMEPMIKDVYAKAKSEKFEMLSITIDETPADVVKHLRAKPFPNPVLLDPVGKAWKEWKVESVPAFFMIKDNQIVWQAKGLQKRETLEQKIAEFAAP